MRRRGATLLVGTVLLVGLFVMGYFINVPYVELGPGPTWDTLGKDPATGKPLITITGVPTTTSAGQLRMVTVGEIDNISMYEALRGWISGNDQVVPRDVIYPPGQTTQQVNQQNAQDFQQSESSAQLAALDQLGYPAIVSVKTVSAGAPADGHLQAGDVITTVDGQPVVSGSHLTDLIRAKPAGTALTVGYTRAGVAGTTSITSKNDSGTPRIGITIDQTQPSPITVNISLQDVGGPSAGLMFSLGIVDKVEPEDLTGGLKIAGTGTIDDLGAVGPIGGIPLKMLGAKRDGATVFLVPADNCAEALKNAVPGLQMVKVTSLQNALDELKTLREHGKPTACTS